MKCTEPILSILMYLPPEYRKQVVNRFNEVNTENEELRVKNKKLCVELDRTREQLDTVTKGRNERNKNMIVKKKQNKMYKPQTGTLWVDSTGTIYFLHNARIVMGEEGVYQLTRLDNGTLKGTSTDKAHLIDLFGMHPYSYSVEIKNESVG